MALAAYAPERREIKVRGQHLGEVQGLTLEHVSVLVREHLPDLEGIVTLFQQGDALNALEAEDWLKLAMPIVTQAPGFVANVIAVAANEKDATPIQSWPISVQIAALMVIFELTFTEIGEVKKALGLIVALQKNKTRTVVGTTKSRKKAK